MRLAVNPTRMELLKLKKRLILARRGHRLLRDKQDELMRNFLSLIEEIKELRLTVEIELFQAYGSFLIARLTMGREFLDEALMFSQLETNLEVTYVPLMNLRIPRYRLNIEGDYFSYGLLTTSMELDRALKRYRELIPKMVELAEKERELEMLSYEIERTRRRVNALEHILIPNIFETISYISMKLEELERSNLTRLMKIKDIVRRH
ncbi:MAG: V-type ATP synthase subunit D [Firmicutes bacterium]|nr:V-type ATP synthase subunit D [Bacillota bacterium]